jgi:hypothetical protein
MFRNTWNAQRTQPPPLTPAAPAPMPPAFPAELAHAPLHMPLLISQFQQQQQQLHKQAQHHMGPAPPPAQAHRSGLPTGMLTPANGQPNSPTLQHRQHQQQHFQQLQGQQAFGSQQHFQQQQQQPPPPPVGFLPHHPALTAAALASMPDGQQLFVANRRHSNDSSGEPCQYPPLFLDCLYLPPLGLHGMLL